MAEGGGAAPPMDAMRGSRGVSTVIVIVVAIVTFVAGVGLGAFVLAPAPARTAPTTIFLGTNTPFPPFEFRNSTTDQLQGFDIEMIETILTRAGYTASQRQWTDFRDFQPLLTAVAAGRIDIGVGAITLSGSTGASRNNTLSFSNSYFLSNQGILKNAADATRYCAAANCTVAELNKTTLLVGVQAITTSEFWVEDNLKAVTGNNNLKIYPDVTQVLTALQNHVVDIVVIDKPAADGISKRNPAFVVGGAIITNELYGFCVQKGDPLGLLSKINAQLASMKADGTYNTILNKWF
jgi:ABC-type amino acid transport substrate-binding protein